MPLFDPSNEPNYSPGAQNYAPTDQNYNYNGSQMPPIDIKKYLPMIIGIIVLLIVGFLLLSWLGSQKEFTIPITDVDGTPVIGKLTLKDASGNLVEVTPKLISANSFKAKLFPGDYTATVKAENYNPLTNYTFTIASDDTGEDPIKLTPLTKNLKATLTASLDVTKIYEKQVIGGKLNIVNSGNAFNLSDIKPVAITPLEVTILPSAETIANPGGALNLDFEVKIKEGSNLTKIMPSSITFKIKGSNISSQKIELQAMPTVAKTDITMTGLTETVKTLTAGTPVPYILIFKNKSKTVTVENLRVEIKADTAFENALNWMTISDAETAANEIIIPTINPLGEEKIRIYVTAPIASKLNEEFRGKIVLSSYSLKEDIEFLTSFKVTKETNVKLNFVMSPKIFNINCSKTTLVCTGMQNLSNGEARFENKGTLAIDNIAVSLDLEHQAATANCQSYFKLYTTKVGPLEAGAIDGTVRVEVTNALESPDTDVAVCILHWEYNNPLDPTTRIKDETTIEINKKTV